MFLKHCCGLPEFYSVKIYDYHLICKSPYFYILGSFADSKDLWSWEKSINLEKKSCIRETPNLSTDADSIKDYSVYFVIFGPTFASCWPNFTPFPHEKETQIGLTECPCCFPTLFQPVQFKIGPPGHFLWPKGYI